MSQQPADTASTSEGGEANQRDRHDADTRRWASAIAALLGLWVLVSAFLYEIPEAALWNNVVVGVAVVVLAGYNFYLLTNERPVNLGSAGLVVLLGLWLIAAPLLLAFESAVAVWSTAISGVLIAVLEGFNVYRERETESIPTADTET